MSRTAAINAKCKDCIYDHKAPGSWREQTENCSSEKTCALWPYRPISIASVNSNRKDKNEKEIDVDSLVDGLEEDDDIDA